MANRRLASHDPSKVEVTPAILVDHLEKELNRALRSAKRSGVELNMRRWANPLRNLVIGSRLEPVPALGTRTKTASATKSGEFHRLLALARAAAVRELGDQWSFVPGAAIGADCKAVRTRKFTDHHGRVWTIKGPRDRHLPAARFWPGGEIPPGPVFNSGKGPVDIDINALQARCDAHALQNRRDMLAYIGSLPRGSQERQWAWARYRSYFSIGKKRKQPPKISWLTS